MTRDHIRESAELKAITAVSNLGLFFKTKPCDIASYPACGWPRWQQRKPVSRL